jgi:hypothetical protein
LRAGYPQTAKLSEVLLQLNVTSVSQLRRDHEIGLLGAQDQSSFEVSVHPPAWAEGEGEMNQVDAGHEIIREWRLLPKEQRQTD